VGGSTTVPLSGNGFGAPAVPTGVTATGLSTSQIGLGWNAVPGADSYVIFRDAQPTPRATVLAPATSFIDTGLQPGTIHTYRLQATNAAGSSALSAKVTAQTIDVVTVTPASPVGFGSVPVANATVTKTITLRNTGTTSLTFGVLTESGTHASNFTVASNLCSGHTVGAGGTCTLKVVFNPSATGLRTATLKIPRVGNSAVVTIALQGTGI
jgi:hypothetical protein